MHGHWQSFTCWAEYRHVSLPYQRCDATNMVAMMVCNQNAPELKVVREKVLLDWTRIARIDRHHLPRIQRRVDEPNVVV